MYIATLQLNDRVKVVIVPNKALCRCMEDDFTTLSGLTLNKVNLEDCLGVYRYQAEATYNGKSAVLSIHYGSVVTRSTDCTEEIMEFADVPQFPKVVPIK